MGLTHMNLTWRKGTYSANQGGCVEVANESTVVHVRDTKDRAGGILTVTQSQWHAFLTAAVTR